MMLTNIRNRKSLLNLVLFCSSLFLLITIIGNTQSRDLLYALLTFFISVFAAFNIFKETKKSQDQAKNQEWLQLKNIEITDELNTKKNELIQNYKILSQLSKMAALGEMSAGIAHEINNPNGIILLKAQQMLKKLNDSSNEKEKLIKYTEQIIQLSNRITQIVQGLKIYAHSCEKLNFTSVSATQIIDEALLLCEKKLTEKNIQFTIQIKQDFTLFCSQSQITQVLINLINNSIDALTTQPQNQPSWIKLEAYEDKQNRLFIFKNTDSGLGISKEIQDKLMNPFFTTKELEKGTGLGLSISKGIIEAHGGELKYNSECKNTQFYFTIPKTAIMTKAA